MQPDISQATFPTDDYIYGRVEPTEITNEFTRNEQVAVGVTALEVSFAKKRKAVLIQNISPNVADVIYVSMSDKKATTTTGIRLKQNESFYFSQDIAFRVYGGQITAVCDTANGMLNIFEL